MRSAIFLDRDGTLNKDEGYTHRIEDYALQEGVVKGLQLLHGYCLIIITNQSGIARGYYTEEEMRTFNHHLSAELKKENIHLQATYHCPHRPDEACACRKPATGMIDQAREDHDIDLENSWVIGDKDADTALAKNVGCKAIHVLSGKGKKTLPQAKRLRPDYISPDFLQAATFIVKKNETKIIPRARIKEKAAEIKRQGKSIVTLNGAFDLLHEGHEYILSQAKKQGDVLIVALNEDATITRNKGEGRPINKLSARQRMLSTYPQVDIITSFPEPDPRALLEDIRPDVHANGAEYGEDCIEAATVKNHGGKIYLIPRIEGFSSTNIIGGQDH